MRLGSGVAGVQASSYSSDSTPSLEFPYATDAALKRQKEKRKKEKKGRAMRLERRLAQRKTRSLRVLSTPSPRRTGCC